MEERGLKKELGNANFLSIKQVIFVSLEREANKIQAKRISQNQAKRISKKANPTVSKGQRIYLRIIR